MRDATVAPLVDPSDSAVTRRPDKQQRKGSHDRSSTGTSSDPGSTNNNGNMGKKRLSKTTSDLATSLSSTIRAKLLSSIQRQLEPVAKPPIIDFTDLSARRESGLHTLLFPLESVIDVDRLTDYGDYAPSIDQSVDVEEAVAAKEQLSDDGTANHLPDVTGVVIVGAGPAGLTLACELARRDIEFVILDINARPVNQSRALLLQSRTLEVFADLRLTEQVASNSGHVVRGTRLIINDKVCMDLRFTESQSQFPFAVALDQSQTERMLIERLAELGHQVHRPVAVWRVDLPNGQDLMSSNEGGQGGESRVSVMLAAQSALGNLLQKQQSFSDDLVTKGTMAPMTSGVKDTDGLSGFYSEQRYSVVHVKPLDFSGKPVDYSTKEVRKCALMWWEMDIGSIKWGGSGVESGVLCSGRGMQGCVWSSNGRYMLDRGMAGLSALSFPSASALSLLYLCMCIAACVALSVSSSPPQSVLFFSCLLLCASCENFYNQIDISTPPI